MTNSVVLIHGTNAGPWTMKNFADYFQHRGFDCHSPAYRNHDVPPSDEVSRQLVGASIADYVDDIATYVTGLETKPILVGHSLGGVVTQKLASMGLAKAIVLLNSSVTSGTLPTTDAERDLGKMFMSAGAFWEETLLPDFETMARFGLNKLDEADRRAVFDRLGPESGRVMFELFFWMFDQNQTTRIDYDAIDCPVLMISSAEDLAIPPSTARKIADRFRVGVDFHEMSDHGHYLTLEPGWQDIAAICATWMTQKATR